MSEPIVTSFTYDSLNNVTSITNALGHATAFDYDSAGNLTRITNAEGNTSSFTYDAEGRRQSFTDFNGNTTTFDYTDNCPCGSPTRVIFADGTYQVFAYNQFGQVTLEEFYEADGTLAQRRETRYDSVGRVTEEIAGVEGDPNHPPTTVRRFYNGQLLDWEIIQSIPIRSTPAAICWSRPPLLSPNAKAGSPILSMTISIKSSGRSTPKAGVVEFRYDAVGNRILLQDPVGNITTWVYDELNRVAEERDPFYNEGLTIDEAIAALAVPSGADVDANRGADHVRVFGYDGEGNQIEMIDRNGRRREFDYDHAGRLLEELWYTADTDTLVETVAFSYDTARATC